MGGGGLGVEMARGDVSFMGLGTVTHVEGTKLCGFGHPMMEAGVTALPAAIGRVHWIFASDQHSSKIGEAARSLGLAGWVRNADDGSVEVEAEGASADVERLRQLLADGPPGARVESIEDGAAGAEQLESPFGIRR